MDHDRRSGGDTSEPTRPPRLVEFPDELPADTAHGLDHNGDSRPVVEAQSDGTLIPVRAEPTPATPRKPKKPRARKPVKRAPASAVTCFGCAETAVEAYRVEGELLPACVTHGLELLAAGNQDRVRIVRRRPDAPAIGRLGRFRLVPLTMAERARIDRIERAEAKAKRRRD